MQHTDILARIEREGVVVGTRGAFPPEHALKMVETMVEMGFTNFEFTMNSEQPIEAMQAVKREYGDDVLVAMGTVLDTETAQRVIDAGVDFIVSPAFQPSVVEYVLGQGIFMAPGVVTPSECVAAWEIGVPLLKLFPIGALGIDYFKAIYGPLSHMKFMCNGAVNAENARQFIGAGAVAMGMSGWLSGDGTWTASKWRSRAQVLKTAIAEARGEQPSGLRHA
jgi:2-dehydro-3-deoxyphosphogluconate aldolase/(4S)-4-hydroxy-2-oxoglutarate aldolase